MWTFSKFVASMDSNTIIVRRISDMNIVLIDHFNKEITDAFATDEYLIVNKTGTCKVYDYSNA